MLILSLSSIIIGNYFHSSFIFFMRANFRILNFKEQKKNACPRVCTVDTILTWILIIDEDQIKNDT